MLRELDVRDAGDVEVSPADQQASLDAIRSAVSTVLGAGAIPRDGSVALAIMRALSEHRPGCAVLHLDAHTDCNPPQPGLGDAATAFWRAHAEGLVDVNASVHVGLRGPTLTPNTAGIARELGYHTVGVDRLLDDGIQSVLEDLRRIVGGRPVYVCWDVDFFDPSVAPGVFSPSWGGISAAQGLRMLHGLTGLRIVAADINTVSPPHDIDGLTAHLAAQLAFELLYALSG